MEQKYVSATDTAKLVRAALKKEFSGTKFSVRTHQYGLGAALEITWTDGPADRDVDAVVAFYRGKGYGGTADYAPDLSQIVDGVEVHYGADYIRTSRKISPEAYEALRAEILTAVGDVEDDHVLVSVPVMVFEANGGRWRSETGTVEEFVTFLAEARARRTAEVAR